MKTNALLLALAMSAILVASASAQVVEIEKIGPKKGKVITKELKLDDVDGTVIIEGQGDDGRKGRRVIRLGQNRSDDGITVERRGRAQIIIIDPDGERHERVIVLGDDDGKAKKRRKGQRTKRAKKARKARRGLSFNLGDGAIDIEIDGKDLGALKEQLAELLGEHGVELREHVEEIIEDHAEEHFEDLHEHLEEMIGEHAEEHILSLRGHIGEMLDGDTEDIEKHVYRLFRDRAAPHAMRVFRWSADDDDDCCEEEEDCDEECEDDCDEEDCEEEDAEHGAERLRGLLGAIRGRQPRAVVPGVKTPRFARGFFRDAPSRSESRGGRMRQIERLQQRLDELRAEMSELDSEIRRLRRKL